MFLFENEDIFLQRVLKLGIYRGFIYSENLQNVIN